MTEIKLSTSVAKNGRLAGKRVLLTGTGGGQGAVAQELFCKHGARVIGCDVRPGSAKETAATLSAQGLWAEGHEVDLADPAAARAWVENSIATLGGIDVLYNNASAVAMAPFGEMTLDQWRFTMTNELEILFTVTSAAWPSLIENGGSVINTASSLGSMGVARLGTAAHSTAKGGVLALTRQLAAEGTAHRVRVNAISPSFIETPGTSMVPQAAKDYFASLNLMGELVEPIDVAYCALYLASDESRFVTGAEFVIDAGSIGGRP
jgi:meso-butanediol dehydrogenase/(S,S)-butanediol dehydrogenase/diacetyl reductase